MFASNLVALYQCNTTDTACPSETMTGYTSKDFCCDVVVYPLNHSGIITSPPGGVAGYCFDPVCLFVCLCVCVSGH